MCILKLTDPWYIRAVWPVDNVAWWERYDLYCLQQQFMSPGMDLYCTDHAQLVSKDGVEDLDSQNRVLYDMWDFTFGTM